MPKADPVQQVQEICAPRLPGGEQEDEAVQDRHQTRVQLPPLPIHGVRPIGNPSCNYLQALQNTEAQVGTGLLEERSCEKDYERVYNQRVILPRNQSKEAWKELNQGASQVHQTRWHRI